MLLVLHLYADGVRGSLSLDVAVPQAQVSVLDALAERASNGASR